MTTSISQSLQLPTKPEVASCQVLHPKAKHLLISLDGSNELYLEMFMMEDWAVGTHLIDDTDEDEILMDFVSDYCDDCTYNQEFIELDHTEIRESYVDGKLFDVGDTVVIKETGEVASVKHLGTNYVIVEKSGNQYRKWLDAVEQVEQPRVEYEVFNEKLNENIYYDVADFSVSKDSIIISNEDVSEAGMQKFKNFEAADTHKTKDGRTAKKGLWYNIHQKRKRGEKPAKPGDKDYPKTLDIEQTMHQTRAAISREKEVEGRRDAADKKRHDSMLDRARMRRTRMVNRSTK